MGRLHRTAADQIRQLPDHVGTVLELVWQHSAELVLVLTLLRQRAVHITRKLPPDVCRIEFLNYLLKERDVLRVALHVDAILLGYVLETAQRVKIANRNE